jgi:hypothetical protein
VLARERQDAVDALNDMRLVALARGASEQRQPASHAAVIGTPRRD